MVYTSLFNYVCLLSFVDYIEMGLLWLVMYQVSVWLAQDASTPLVLYFYAYFMSFVCAEVMGLPVVSKLLWLSLPVVLVLFIVFHHEKMQRNFVTFRTIRQPHSYKLSKDTITIIMRSLLQGLNAQRPIKLIIEQADTLQIKYDILVDASISTDVLNLIFTSDLWVPEQFVVLSRMRLKGFNARAVWESQGMIQGAHDMPAWLQDALLLTAKTDALVISIDPSTRYFTLVAQGKLLEHINAETAARLLQAYCGEQSKGEAYEIFAKEMAQQQSQS